MHTVDMLITITVTKRRHTVLYYRVLEFARNMMRACDQVDSLKP